MYIYILIILLILFLRMRLASIGNVSVYEKTEKRYLYLICWILVLISAFRGETVGTDTHGYMSDYLQINMQSYTAIYDLYADFIGFYLPSKFLANLHAPLQLWLGLIAAVYILPVTVLIDRNAHDKLYAILCFFLMGAFSFSMAGLKQTVAMGALLIGFIAFCDKKYIYTILFSIWAYYCHKTSVVFVFVYPLFLLRHYKHYYRFLLPLLVIVIIFFKEFLIFGLEQMESERYLAYLDTDKVYSKTSFIFYLTLLIISYLLMDRANKEQSQTLKFAFGMSACSTVFQTFAFVSASAFRIGIYYLPFFAILLSNSFENRSKIFCKIMVAVMIIFFFLYVNRNGSSISPYYFIWEGVTAKSL